MAAGDAHSNMATSLQQPVVAYGSSQPDEGPSPPQTVVEDSATHELEMKAVDEEKGKALAVAGQWDSAPDGGYGWVVVACGFGVSVVTWGVNSSFGVFISYFKQRSYYDASATDYSWVAGASVATALAIAPLANFLARRFSFRVPLAIGAVCTILGQCMAGISPSFGSYAFCQGVLFGMGLGLTFIPMPPIAASWFNARLSTAIGIVGSGSGVGTVIFSNSTRACLDKVGLRNTLVINGCVTAAIIIPAVALMKPRRRDETKKQAKLETLQLSWLIHPGMFWVWTWAFLSVAGYLIALFTLASYATDGLGLTQTQGAILQSMIGAGQAFGRPATGCLFDWGGRVNMAILIHFLSGLSCVALWLPARSFALLVVFAFLQGGLGGTVWSSAGGLTAKVVGSEHMGSALIILWLSMAPPSLVAQVISTELLNYSRNSLGRTGPEAYQISIGLCGGLFFASAAMLLGAKVYVQKSWKIMQKV